MSADGRYTVFLSDASNLVPGDTNGVTDVFVRDNATRAVVRFTDGRVDNESRPAITRDGSRVAYTVYRSTDSFSVLAVVDRATVSVAWSRAATNSGQRFRNPSINDNGRAVVFELWSFPANTSQVARANIEDTTLLLAPRTDGLATGQALHPKIDATGMAVVFDSTSTNYVSPDDNGSSDVFYWGRTIAGFGPIVDVMSRAYGGTAPNANGDSGYADFLGSYSYSYMPDVVFASWATNLMPGDTNGHQDIFVSRLDDDGSHVIHWVHERLVGGNDDSSLPTGSADGRFVSFVSKASDLVAGDTNGLLDVFVKDRGAAVGAPSVWRVSTSGTGGQVDGASSWPRISGNGRWVSYESDATNLIADANGVTDVFTGYAGKVSVTSISPSSFARGASTVAVTIDGNGFRAPAQVSASSPAITFSNVTVIDEHTITADVTVAADAPASATLEVAVDAAPLSAGTGASGSCACITTTP